PQNPFRGDRSGDLPCAIGRFAPSLPPRGLRPADFHWLTRLGTSVGSSVTNKEQSAPTQHLRPRTQPISCRDTLFRTTFEVHFELWRATTPFSSTCSPIGDVSGIAAVNSLQFVHGQTEPCWTALS